MTSKSGTEVSGQPNQECCACGDRGFSDELFQCKVCHFRSQHRYCSNLYPKAKSYETCNLCLSQKEDIEEKSPNSSNSSSSYKNNVGADDDESKRKKTRNGDSAQNIGVKKQDKPIKKQRSSEARSPSTSPSVLLSTTRKRIVTDDAFEQRLKRTKSETKQVFRNKVRRYKLLDEVSS